MRRLLVGVSGASGMPLALTLMRALRAADVEIHLIVTPGAQAVLRAECDTDDTPLRALAHTHYDAHDMSSAPASGSWHHTGMIVCPCSMSTLGSIAQGVGRHLVHRAADVTLKEGRPLILVTRETPLSRIHVRNMLLAQEAGAVIMPFCPGFYGRPTTLDDLLEHTAGRILDQLAIAHQLGYRWGEKMSDTML